jgi:hypothetical protein
MASDLMVRERSIDPLPKIAVADRFDPTKSLPAPLGETPLVQTTAYAAGDVSAGCNEGDARRLIERLQAADDRQELRTLARSVRLFIGGGQVARTVNRLQDELPAARLASRHFGRREE